MRVTIGRIVLYTLTPQDAEQINRRRTTGALIAERIQNNEWPLGAQAHIGNEVAAGNQFPLVVTKVWAEHNSSLNTIAGQVLLDGNDCLWVKASPEALNPDSDPEPGTWVWPPRV